MDIESKGSIPKLEDFQIEGTWIPATPVKTSLTSKKPICANRQENQPSEASWLYSETFLQGNQISSADYLEPGKFSSGFPQETQANWIEGYRGFDNWEAALTTKSPIYTDNVVLCNKFSADSPDKRNVTFSDLLALANAASATVAPANATAQTNVNVTGNSFTSIFNSHVEANQFKASSSSVAHHELSFGSNFPINNNCSTDIPQYGCSIPSRPLFDLNSPPKTVTDAVFNRNISNFAPLTPDRVKRIEKSQASDVPHLSGDERTTQAGDTQYNEVAIERVKVTELHHEKERSQLQEYQACATVSTQFQEIHNPDMGGNQGTDLNKTQQQKPRRKKHRPKVVIEGQPKRTPKPVTTKPAGPKETPTGKRKYVRKNKLDKRTATPSAEATSRTTDPKIVGQAKRSCRRSLKFDFESQVRHESSTCRPSSNSESQAQNFYSRAQSKSAKQLGEGMEAKVEKTQVEATCDLTCCTNGGLKDYHSIPEEQAPSPLPPAKIDPPRENLMADAQNECTRGKCRIVFSDETHDKEASTVQMTNIQAQLVPCSLNDSNCSPSACLTKGNHVRGLKRGHSSTIASSQNAFVSHYHSLQSIIATFSVNEHTDNRITSMHFPLIHKKKRTEKGYSAKSITLSTTAENAARQTAPHLNDASANPFSSETNCRTSTLQFDTGSTPTKIAAVRGAQDKQQTSKCMLALGQTERLTKKRSKGPTRVRNLTSLIVIVDSKQLPTSVVRDATSSITQRFGASYNPPTCMEALVADTCATMATKKRTKRNSISSSMPPTLYDYRQLLKKSKDPPPGIIWKGRFSTDAIVEQLKHLDINSESKHIADQEKNPVIPYNRRYQEQNALVLYQRDGTVVPFGGSFEPVKKRRPRAKVNLDDETNRVWKLLLEDINSQGIDGTNEEKTKWWDEERKVFRGRADSFIARMHLIQGDRRFSQWKGSVVDSVIGVFLTQNVSDHLSSSAFMSLAAQFPLKSNSHHEPCYEERPFTLVKEPEVCMLDTEDTIRWQEEKLNKPTHAQSAMKLHNAKYNEEKEVVNSNESFGSSTVGPGSTESLTCNLLDSSQNGLDMNKDSPIQITGSVASFTGDQREIFDDILSSQNSVVSSQNSVDSSLAQNTERIESCSQSNPGAELTAGCNSNSFGWATSFVKLLQMQGTTMLHGIYNNLSGSMSSNEDFHSQSQGIACNSQNQNKDRSDGPEGKLRSKIPSNNYHLHPSPYSELLEVEFCEMLEAQSRSADISTTNEENCPSEQSGLSLEFVSQAIDQRIMTVSSQEATKYSRGSNHPCNSLQVEMNKNFDLRGSLEDPKSKTESQRQENNYKIQHDLDAPNFSVEALDVREGKPMTVNSGKTELKAVELNLNKKGHLPGKTVNGMNGNISSAKKGRIGKEKQNVVDWDSIRKQAQANGKKRERTANTMDSVDWEAVRCANVNEIANTIKERGMNNMLAERIKDFLNRLVKEHGSNDLEWLRDIPPDKAKEYLLSIRGLGLKSVECVRLLTLHHLAFPVDTNVGRIAVRLGWVPLQPLPESLQLHLLELYPVLESIQKYLWPRLCKLDQRTLYELHYQMITFGKVFCTKSKPNCNACPMRGECRHFASAFASARLALPAPEEKSIVSSIENKAADQKYIGIINPLQLPLSQVNQQREAHFEIGNCEPIIEVPATPEPIIEVPATPEPEQIQVAESNIEDTFCEDPDEIPTIRLNIKEFTQNLHNYMQQNMELQKGDMSKALVAFTPEAASIPMPKLKNVSRLRTEHQVYELPDSHPLLEGLDKREPDDPCSYLLAIWTPGETASSIQPPERTCSSQELGKLCDEKTCFSCSSIREANSQTVRGTLLIPCRTAMRGSFPLNGTYFQVNEVFADHESSLNPIDVPRALIWNLPRRMVYFGTSIPTIFKGLSTEGIQYCFWRGFVCVRGFDQRTRAPRPLMARLHFPASKLTKTRGKNNEIPAVSQQSCHQGKKSGEPCTRSTAHQHLVMACHSNDVEKRKRRKSGIGL